MGIQLDLDPRDSEVLAQRFIDVLALPTTTTLWDFTIPSSLAPLTHPDQLLDGLSQHTLLAAVTSKGTGQNVNSAAESVGTLSDPWLPSQPEIHWLRLAGELEQARAGGGEQTWVTRCLYFPCFTS